MLCRLGNRPYLLLFLVLLAVAPGCASDGSGDAPGADAVSDATAPQTDQVGLDLPTPPVDVPVPPADVPTPPADVPTPPDDVPALPKDVPALPEDVPAPPDDVPAPPDDVPTPPEDVPAPPEDVPGPGEDAGPPVRNILENGGFEEWSDGRPILWIGEATSLSVDAIQMTSVGQHGGDHAVRLTNASDNHRRFSTAGYHMEPGDYRCTYWVRGSGSIRNAHYHGLEGNGFSSYESYVDIADDSWRQLSYEFRLPSDTDVFELIFSLQLTDSSAGDLELDDVVCARLASPCDTVTCEDWARCDLNTGECVALSGRCGSDADCWSYEVCQADHTCALGEGRCETTADCDVNGPTPLCDRATYTCIAGDPCGGVTCDEWKVCWPETGLCVLREGRCMTSADCLGTLPACDVADHTCKGADDAANLMRGGGFEEWAANEWGDIVPVGWFGQDIPGSNEIDAENVREWTDGPHSGAKACQLVQTGISDRFTTEAFDLPSGTFTCGYWVRGYGQIRHRYYSSGGWSVETERVTIESDVWLPFHFQVEGNVRDLRLIFYASYTDAARGHLLLDDVVCTRN